MGVGIVDSFSLKPLICSIHIEKIIGIIELMSALAENCTVILLGNLFCSFDHIIGAFDLPSGKHLGFRDIRGEKICKRKQFFLQNIHRLLTDQSCTACGNHNRVHHDIFCPILSELSCDHMDQITFGNHSDLYCIRKDIRKNTVQLLTQELCGCILDGCDTGGVLGSQRGDGTHGVYSVCHHGFNIGLDPGSSAGIAACDG